MNDERIEHDDHLTDAELFALAAPAAGEPEALIPAHLSRCRDCARALREWKAAMGAAGEADAGELSRRTPEEWRAAEDATLDAIRMAARPARAAHPWRWALAAAASLLLAAVVLVERRAAPAAGTLAAAHATPTAASADSDLTAEDAADDRLLREASYLAGGGDVDSGSGLEGRL